MQWLSFAILQGDPEKPPLPEGPPLPGEEKAVDLKFHDEGNIELVLKVLALMCDGQNRELQVKLKCNSNK